MNTGVEQDNVIIFDTTLRDGEQSPGYSMSVDQKIVMARTLADLGVDVMEAGFPAASEGDFAAVQRIAREIRGPQICGLARCNETDISAAARAVEPAQNGRIHTFLATSPIHREHKLGMSKAQVVKAVVAGVRQAVSSAANVEFSAEDAIRTEREFLVEVFEAAIDAGATTINVPDTVGYSTPEEIYDLFSFLMANVRGMDKVIVSAHCHDDLGLAVANSLAAVRAGARQIECTINGIGERAGNCSLEEAVMALKTRAAHFGAETGIRTEQLYEASQLLSRITGNTVARNKAIVGRNAFAHEAGIHQHGVLKNRETYEIMRPEDVGVPSSELVLGKHSGRHAVADRARALGYDLRDNQLNSVFVAFKALCDRKKEVSETDLEFLILGQDEEPGPWTMGAVQVNSSFGSGQRPTATVELQHRDGYSANDAATGDDVLDAVFNAIRRVTGSDVVVTAVDSTRTADESDIQGGVSIQAEADGRPLRAQVQGQDIMAATAEAFVTLVNMALRRKRFAARMGMDKTPSCAAA